MKLGLEMSLSYRKDAIVQMMNHAHDVLGYLPEDDDTRSKWNSFFCGCEDMLQLMNRAEQEEG